MLFESSVFPPNAKPETAAQKHPQQEASKTSTDERIADYTWWLAVLNGALVFTAIGQGFFIARSDKTARIAAVAARDAAGHIPRVERAYVFFASTTCEGLKNPDGTVLIVKYSFKNSGRTPAIMKRIQIGAEYLENGLPTDAKFTYGDGILPAPLVVGSDGTHPEHDIQLWITGPDYEKAKVGIGRIFFWAKLTYHDVFGFSHETGICSEWHFGQSRFVISTDCAELNYYT